MCELIKSTLQNNVDMMFPFSHPFDSSISSDLLALRSCIGKA